MIRLAFLTIAALVLALPTPSLAVPEIQASTTNPLVAAAWHSPAVIEPGTQWHGYLQLRPDHGVARVGYQVCNAGDGYCFAPTHDAQDLGNGTYRFDTADYLASNGEPVDWKAGWHVGVRWFLADGSGNGTWVPRAPPGPTEQVAIEDLYLTFDVPGDVQHGAPGLALPSLLAALAATLVVRRRA